MLGGCALAYDFTALSAGDESALSSEGGEAGASSDAERAGDGSVADPDGSASLDASDAADVAVDAPPDAPPGCTVTTAGPLLPGTTGLASSGVAWSSLSSAQTEDSVASVASLTVASDESSLLVVRQFGFAVPAGASIRGVRVSVRGKATASDPEDVRDEELKLVVGGAVAGASLDTAKWSSAYVTRDYGGPTNLWGLALTPAIVNDPQFGAAFRAKYHGATSGTAEVDVIRVAVYYCL